MPLKLRRRRQTTVLCSQIVDEIAIRQGTEWTGTNVSGFLEFGNEGKVAKEAYVFLVNCIHSHWKIPVGYFFVAGLSADQRAQLVRQCLTWLITSGVKGRLKEALGEPTTHTLLVAKPTLSTTVD